MPELEAFDQFLYLLIVMHEADKMGCDMSPNFPSVFEVDVDQGMMEHNDREICHLESRLRYFLGSRTLFDPSVGSVGPGYSNPSHYLEIALINTSLEWDKIVDEPG